MKHAAGTVAAMLAIVLALLALSAAALWQSSPEVEDAARAVYHAVTGACRHALAANRAEIFPLAALGMLVGVAVVLVRFTRDAVRRWHRTRRRLAPLLERRVAHWPAEVRGAAARLKLASNLDLVGAAVPFAFCHGLLHPRICVSTGLVHLLTPAELEAVLLHEDDHRRRRDPLLLLVTDALVHALFFIPVLRDLQARYDAVKEFDADAAAVHQHGGLEPIAGALYKVLSCPAAAPDLNAAAASGLSVTERRIDHLVAPHAGDVPPLSRCRLAASVLAVSAVSLPLLSLSVVHIQPLVHACWL